jgi:hypothetical protein
VLAGGPGAEDDHVVVAGHRCSLGRVRADHRARGARRRVA